MPPPLGRRALLGWTLAFVALAWGSSARFAAQLPTWSEELRVQPRPPVSQWFGGERGGLRRSASCARPALDVAAGATLAASLAVTAPAPASALLRQPSPPLVSLCVGGGEGAHAWPLLVVGYYGSALWSPPADLAYRALGHRGWRLLAAACGGLGLLLLALWLRYLLPAAQALAVAALTGATGCFSALHAIAVPYELLAWPLAFGALIALERWRAEGAQAAPRFVWPAAIGVLVGVAVGVNVKSLFFLVPLCVWTWRHRPPPCGVGGGGFAALAAAGAGAVLGLLPAALPTMLQGADALTAQGGQRLALLAARWSDLSAARLLDNTLAALDTAFAFARQLSVIGGDKATATPLRPLWALLVGACLGLGAASLWRWPVRRPGGAPASARGALAELVLMQALVMWLVSTFLYGQTPQVDALYIYGVFGLAVWLPLAAAADALRWPAGPWRAAAVAVVAAALLFEGHLRLGAGFDRGGLTLPQQRAQLAWLQERLAAEGAGGGGPVLLTTTYNEVGVVEALSRGQTGADHAHAAFERCRHAAAPASCRATTAGDLLDAYRDSVVLALVLARPLAIDAPGEVEFAAALEQAARQRGRAVQRVPPPPAAGPRLALLRVGPSGASASAGAQPLEVGAGKAANPHRDADGQQQAEQP